MRDWNEEVIHKNGHQPRPLYHRDQCRRCARKMAIYFPHIKHLELCAECTATLFRKQQAAQASVAAC